MHWVLREQPDIEAVRKLAAELKVPRIISSILISRDVKTYEEARLFFRGGYEELYDPFLMKDMDRAVERILKAVENREKILIYGDYDVDGATSVSMLYLFFSALGNEVFFHIPDRLEDGYGLSVRGVERALELGVSLLITVDCGITALEEVELARENDIDIIVSDHHEPGPVLPNAVAILDPKRPDSAYPFKELAGVGVAFKLIQAVSGSLGLEETFCRQYLDLVSLGSVADIVPLLDENRILVRLGMEIMNATERPGLKSLIAITGLQGKKIGTGQVVFILAPRINAVGRMGNAERAVRLLITGEEQLARNMAGILETENRERRNIDDGTYQEAIRMLQEEGDVGSAVVLAREGWHSGVIGIVASRVAEFVYRPTIMIAIEDGIGKGSARSIANFDVYRAMKECEHLLIDFGGHKYAAGLSIEAEKIPLFRERFQQVAAAYLSEEDYVQKQLYDAEISLDEISDKLFRLINQLAPFGPGNTRPVFMTRDVQVAGTPRIVGGNHLKFKARQAGRVFDAIGFNLGHLQYRLEPGEPNLDMVYVIEENYWNGQSKIQLRVKDLR
ncbi:single-stranded-DNA-specific exonuclease RecJ [bacterium]|nr:single-stranded-DNA-specific exonuclease RecJ [bacterium]